jgi:hypothetical protein
MLSYVYANVTIDILKSAFLKERKGAEKVPRRRRRLPKEAIKLIKAEKSSYTKIQEKVRKRWGIKIAKSTVSYYKRQRPRIKPIDLEAIPQEDWHWFQGLFSADGNKTISQDKSGKHFIIKISLSKKHDLSIARKCMQILKTIGLNPTMITERNCLRVKASSKSLFSALSKKPPKERLSTAYVAGAMDGDGWIDNHAIQFGQSKIPELFDGITDFFNRRGMPVATWHSKKNYRRMYIPYSTLKSSGVLRYSLKAQSIH